MAKIQVIFTESLAESRATKLPPPPTNAVSVAIPASRGTAWVRCNSAELAARIGKYRGAEHAPGALVVRISVPLGGHKPKEHVTFLLTQDGFKVEKK